jgi:ectoine hydroxylase-related dioxygenase (phytanoyl-CoA dioxygenase family)
MNAFHLNLQKISRRGGYLFHPIGFILENLAFKLKKKDFSSKYLVTTFLLLGGKPGSFFSRLMGKKVAIFVETDSESLIASNAKINNVELRENGYAEMPSALSDQTIHKLLKISLETKGANRGMDSGKGFEDNIFFDRKNPKTVRFDIDSNILFKNSIVQELACDPTVLRIAQDYLGALPILDFAAMWWHVRSNTPDKEAAQYFHFDMDRLRWIKFFFYVTDVTENSGPHIFIPKSHTDTGLPFPLRAKGYTRLTDDEVAIYFPRDTWKEFVGPIGSMIVEDTRGLHKGKHVHEGDRLVFQLQYTSSLFGKAILKTEVHRNDIGDKLKKSMSVYPEIFQQIKVIE